MIKLFKPAILTTYLLIGISCQAMDESGNTNQDLVRVLQITADAIRGESTLYDQVFSSGSDRLVGLSVLMNRTIRKLAGELGKVSDENTKRVTMNFLLRQMYVSLLQQIIAKGTGSSASVTRSLRQGVSSVCSSLWSAAAGSETACSSYSDHALVISAVLEAAAKLKIDLPPDLISKVLSFLQDQTVIGMHGKEYQHFSRYNGNTGIMYSADDLTNNTGSMKLNPADIALINELKARIDEAVNSIVQNSQLDTPAIVSSSRMPLRSPVFDYAAQPSASIGKSAPPFVPPAPPQPSSSNDEARPPVMPVAPPPPLRADNAGAGMQETLQAIARGEKGQARFKMNKGPKKELTPVQQQERRVRNLETDVAAKSSEIIQARKNGKSRTDVDVLEARRLELQRQLDAEKVALQGMQK